MLSKEIFGKHNNGVEMNWKRSGNGMETEWKWNVIGMEMET